MTYFQEQLLAYYILIGVIWGVWAAYMQLLTRGKGLALAGLLNGFGWPIAMLIAFNNWNKRQECKWTKHLNKILPKNGAND